MNELIFVDCWRCPATVKLRLLRIDDKGALYAGCCPSCRSHNEVKEEVDFYEIQDNRRSSR